MVPILCGLPLIVMRSAGRKRSFTNEMTVQLSRGHAEIALRFRETMESLNRKVQMLKNDMEMLEKERDNFREASTKYMNEITT